MASTSSPIQAGSDAKCLDSCNLKFGISESFNENLQSRQKVSASKVGIQPQIFTDPKEQAKYNHVMGDDILKTFDDDSEKKIFRKALEGMELNYPEILNGTEKRMFYYPPAFNVDLKINENETSVSELLENLQPSLEVNKSLTEREEENLRLIRRHLKNLRPQLAEQELVDALAVFFFKHRGMFVNSLKLDEHLKVLTHKAKMIRRKDKTLAFTMTDLEEKLAKQLGISPKTLTNFADDFIKNLMIDPKVIESRVINGRLIRKAVDDNLKGNESIFVKKIFKPGSDYSMKEIEEGVKLGKFQSDCHFSGENDLLIVLPDSRLILCIEIKRNTSCQGQAGPTSSRKNKQIDISMKCASSLLDTNADFLSLSHGDILSPDWQFAKICAISPSFNNPELICKNCNRFILTPDILTTPGGLDKWWKETGLADRAINLDQKAKDDAYNEFQLMFNRLVCLSSVRIVPDPLNHSHGAYKVVFLNRDQIALLASDKLLRVLFMCDFGAGKSM